MVLLHNHLGMIQKAKSLLLNIRMLIFTFQLLPPQTFWNEYLDSKAGLCMRRGIRLLLAVHL